MPSPQPVSHNRTPGGTPGRGSHAAISLLFAAGQRPGVCEIETLLNAPGAGMAARISHRPDPGEGWVEILVNGLAFDLRGLSPADPAAVAATQHTYGFDGYPAVEALEAVELVPSRHVAAGSGLAPVVRAMAGLAANLALHARAEAVIWQPAQTLMEPGYFSRIVFNWLSGGPFPALGLTALVPAADGSVTSAGLSHFIGQEMHLEAGDSASQADGVKLAIRAVDHLVRHGPLQTASMIEGGTHTLLAEPSHEGRRVWVSRQSA